MLRRFSNRREAVPESIAAKSLGRTKPIHTRTGARYLPDQAAPLVSSPVGKSRRRSETRAVEGATRKPAYPWAGGELR